MSNTAVRPDRRSLVYSTGATALPAIRKRQLGIERIEQRRQKELLLTQLRELGIEPRE
jgi:hypothetical protein